MQKSTLNPVLITRHPLTGAPIRPVGFRRDGRPIWPVMGGAPDGDDKNVDDKKGEPDAKGDDKPGEGDKPDGDQGAGGKDALKADLARERDKRQDLEKSLAEMKDGFAKALGLKPEETSDTDRLAKSISSMQERLDQADRRAQVLEVASEFAIGKDDLHMLTASDEAGLRKQAEWIQSKTEQLEKGAGKPRSDRSQGGGEGNERSGSIAAIMRERRAAREAASK